MTLETQIELLESRVQRFRELKKTFAKGEYPEKLGYESNDISTLAKASHVYERAFGIRIPEDLIDEANVLLIQQGKSGPGIYASCSKDEIKRNSEKYAEFFRRCEELERKLHQLLLDKKTEVGEGK